MQLKSIAYWLTTGLFSLALGGSALAYLSGQQFMVEALHEHLGFPVYMLSILGVAKALGVVGLWQRVSSTITEWAYAGFTFNLLGATWSHLAVGDSFGESVAPLFLLGVLAVSYALRPSRQSVARNDEVPLAQAA